MRLRRFTVEGFAQLDHVDIEFRDEAPNIIFGLNEAGKSHLMQAFCGMFFPIEHVDQLVPWVGEPVMHGALEFIDADGRLVRLERDFAGANVVVSVAGQEAWTGRVKGSTTDALRFADSLQSWLGFRDQELFGATTFVRQADVIMQESGADRRSLAFQVKGLITGTQETSYERVLTDLQKELDALRRAPGARKDREIEEKRAELEQLRTLYATTEHDHDRYSGLEHELAQLGRDNTRDKTERKTIEQRLRDASSLMDRETELMKLDADFQKLDHARLRFDDLNEKLAAASERCDGLASFAAIDEVELTTAQRDVDEARREVARLSQGGTLDPTELSKLVAAVQHAQRDLDPLPAWPDRLPIELIQEADRETSAAAKASPEPARERHINWLIVLGVATVGVILTVVVHPLFLILVAGAALYAAASHFGIGAHETAVHRTERQPSAEKLSALLARAGVATVPEAELRWQARQEAEDHLSKATGELRSALSAHGVATVEQAHDRRRQRHDAEEALAQAQTKHDALLRDLGVESIEQAAAEFKKLRDARQDADKLEAAIGMLADKEHLDAEWESVGRDLSGTRFDVSHLLDRDPELKALGTPEMRATYVGTLKDRFQRLQSQIEERSEREHDLRLDQADLGRAALQDIPVLREQIQDLESDITRLERKARALQIATDELRAAVSHFRDHCLGEVMQDTSSFLRTVTDGRYTSVDVTSDDLVPTVITSRRAIPAHQLSRGVQDQLYFALRVALARAITRGRTLPLVLDDPFVNFDPIRRERVLALLRGLVDRTQVILFTCDPWYGERITPICELAPAEASTSSNAIVDVA